MALSGCTSSRQSTQSSSHVTAQPVAKTSPAPSAPVDFTADSSANARAAREAERLESHLRTRADFGGIAVVAAGVQVSATGAGIAPAVRAIIGSRPPVPVVFRPVVRSWHHLITVSAALNRDRAQLARGGIQLVGWGPDVRTNTVWRTSPITRALPNTP
jgi:hypothetical protein